MCFVKLFFVEGAKAWSLWRRSILLNSRYAAINSSKRLLHIISWCNLLNELKVREFWSVRSVVEASPTRQIYSETVPRVAENIISESWTL